MYPLDPTRPMQAIQVGLSPPQSPPESLLAPADDTAPSQAIGMASPPPYAVTSTIEVRPLAENRRPKRALLVPLNQHPSTLPLEARLPPGNLAEVLQQLEHLTSMPRRKHKDTMSAVRIMGRVLDRPLSDIPTVPAQLRPLVTKAHPALAELSPARWTTVRSLVLGALSELGIEVMPGRVRKPLSPAWQALYAALPDKRCRYGLSRIVHFFCSAGLEPKEVDAAALTRYREKLLATSLRREVNPEVTFKVILYHWKRAAETVPGWPAAALTTPNCSRRYALPFETFPASFRTDVEAFLNHTANPDVFAEDYAEPVKASTNRVRRRQILQLASAMIAAGKPIDDLTSLAALVEISNAQAALRHLLNRRDGQKGKGLGHQAQLLRTIARHWVKASPATVERLSKMAAGLTPKKEGMVAKNRDRLRQFDLDANIQVLLNLPGRVLERVQEVNTGKRKDALRVMFALAVEILTHAPMRVTNLCEFDLDRDLVETRRGKSRHRRMSIDKTRTKTTVCFERELVTSTSALLDVYLSTYRPQIHPSPGGLLFPGRNGAVRASTRFSTAISEFIYRESGLTMNPQLFRHLMIKLHGILHPDDTETGRLTLGHTTSATIARNYAENRTDNAFKRWDDTLAQFRDKPLLFPNHSPRRTPK